MNKLQVSNFKLQGALLTLLLSLTLLNCSGEKSANEETLDRLNQKELQLYTAGRQLYTQYCQNCHMEDGNGLGQLIPPLANSDYLLNDLEQATRVIKYGQRGPIVVNNKAYNQPMPANPQLTHQEIQMILTYIGNAWGNQSSVLAVEEIQGALQAEEN